MFKERKVVSIINIYIMLSQIEEFIEKVLMIEKQKSGLGNFYHIW